MNLNINYNSKCNLIKLPQQLISSRVSTRSRRKQRNLYFQKHYILHIHSITFKQKINLSTYSQYASRGQQCQSSQTIFIDDIIDVCVIDVVPEGVVNSNVKSLGGKQFPNQVQLQIYQLKQGKRIQIASCIFDMNQQKIVKQQSRHFTKAPLSQRSQQGFIQYKFISLRTRQFSFEQFQQQIQSRNQQMKYELDLEEDPDLKALREILAQKNKIIDLLEKKVQQLVNQLQLVKKQSAAVMMISNNTIHNKNINNNLSFRQHTNNSLQKQINKSRATLINNTSLEKRPISLNVKVTASQQHIKQKIKQFKNINLKLSKQMQQIKQQKIILEKENILNKRENNVLKEHIEVLKKQLEELLVENNNSNKNQRQNQKDTDMMKKSRITIPNKQSFQSWQGSEKDKHQIVKQRKKSSQLSRKDSSLSLNSIKQGQKSKYQKSKASSSNANNHQELDFIIEQKNPHLQESKQVLDTQAQHEAPQITVRVFEQPRVRFDEILEMHQITAIKITNSTVQKSKLVQKSIITPTKQQPPKVHESQYIFFNNTPQKNDYQQKFQKSSIATDKLRDENGILIEKLRLKELQVQRLKSDLQFYQKKVKTAQQNVEDLRQMGKSMHLQRLQMIKSQRHEAIKDLHGGTSRNSPTVEHILYKQKMQTQVEKLRFEIKSLREKNRQLTQYKAVRDQRERIQVAKLTRQNTVLKQQKQMFQTRYNEIAEKYRHEVQENKRLQVIQYQHQRLTEQHEQITKAKQQAQQNFQQSSQTLKSAQQQVKKLSQRLKQRQGQWRRLKMLQTQHEPMSKKIANLQKSNQRYQNSLNDLKKYAMKIQSLFYQVRKSSTTKPKNQNQNQKQLQQLDNQLTTKLEMLKTQLGSAFRSIYQGGIQMLQEMKKSYNQQFSNKQLLQAKMINESVDLMKLNLQQKNKLINEKLKSLQSKKQKVLAQLQSQIKRLQTKNKQYEQSVKKFDKSSVLQKVAELQKMVSLFKGEKNELVGIAESLKLKNSKLQQQAHSQQLEIEKMKQSHWVDNNKTSHVVSENNTFSLQHHQMPLSQHQQQQSKPTTLSSLPRINNQLSTKFEQSRKVFLQQLNKNRAQLSKTIMTLNTQNQTIMREKVELQSNLRAINFKMQKQKLRYQEQKRTLQIKLTKQLQQTKREMTKMAEKIKLMDVEIVNLKEEVKEYEQKQKKLIQQLLTVNQQYQTLQNQLIQLQTRLKQSTTLLKRYEQAQRLLVSQVQSIKQSALFAENQFKSLLQQRNEHFLKIQQIKQTQIAKLDKLREYLQHRLQQQVMQTLTVKRQSDQYQSMVETLQNRVKQTQQQMQLMKQAHQKGEEQNIQIIKQLQSQNLQLQKHLLQLAQQSQNKQLFIKQQQTKIQALNKQISMLQNGQKEFIEREKEWFTSKVQYQNVVSDQKQHIQRLKSMFDRLQRDVQIKAIEYTNTLMELQKANGKIQVMQRQLKSKQRKTIQLQVKQQSFQQKTKQRQQQLYQTLQSYKMTLKQKEDEVEEIKIRLSQRPQGESRSKSKSRSKSRSRSKLNDDLIDSPLSSSGLRLETRKKLSRGKDNSSRQLKQQKSDRSNKQKQQSSSSPRSKQQSISSQSLLSSPKLQSKRISNNNNTNTNINNNKIITLHIVQQQPITNTNPNIQSPHQSQIRVQVQNDKSQSQNMQQVSVQSEYLNDEQQKQQQQCSLSIRQQQQQQQQYQQQQSDMARYEKSYQYQHQQQQQQNSNVDDDEQESEQNDQQNDQQNNNNADDDIKFFYNNSHNNMKKMTQTNINTLLRRIAQLQEENQSLHKEMAKISQQQYSALPNYNNDGSGDYHNLNNDNNNSNNNTNCHPSSFQQINNNHKSLTKHPSSKYIYTNERFDTKEQFSYQQNHIMIGSDDEGRKRNASVQRLMNGKKDVMSDSKSVGGGDGSRGGRYSDKEGRNNYIHNNNFNNNNIINSRSFIKHKVIGSDGQLQTMNYNNLPHNPTNQLIISQLQDQLATTKQLLQQQKASTQKLMKQLQLQMCEIQKQSTLIQQKYHLIQQMKLLLQRQRQQHNKKMQQLLQQLIQKQHQLSQSIKHLQHQHNKLQQLQQQYSHKNNQLQHLQQILYQTQNKLQSSRLQYRKYEEQAQLQILSLKEKMDVFLQKIKEKQLQLEVIGERYLSLEQQKKILQQDVYLHNQLLQAKETKIQAIMLDYQKNIQQFKKTQTARKQLLTQLQNMQAQNLHLQSTLQQLNKSFTLQTKKHTIQQLSNQEHIQNLTFKIRQKDQHITKIKGEIGNFNDDCQLLRRENNQYKYQLQKVQKQLKQIMLSYQQQQDQLNMKYNKQRQKLQQLQQIYQVKQQQLSLITKQLRVKQKQCTQLKYKLTQITLVYQKYKQSKQKQFHLLSQQFTYKQSEYQKLKYTIQKQHQQWFNSQCKYLQQQSLYEKQLKQYKQKLSKYQTQLNDISTLIMREMQERPTKQHHQQVLLQNEIFKNRIKQLQQKHKKQQQKVINQNIAQQYKRYKLSKQVQINDLQSEISQYSKKMLQLEQQNYHMRKDVNTLKGQLKGRERQLQNIKELLQQKDQQLQETKSELQFYQRKRTQQLNKLLNQTMGSDR